MRIVPLVIVMAACGRIGFPASDEAGTALDGRPLDDAGLGDPNGYWVWTSGKLAGEITTRTRSDLQNGVFGDLAIAGSSSNARVVLLGNGVPTAMGATQGTLTVDGARWIANDGNGSVAVFDVVWADPDHVALTVDPTAPETVGTSDVDMVALERASPPPSELQGLKTPLRVHFPNSGEIATNQCAPFRTSDSQRVSGTTMTSSQFVVTVHFEFRYFLGTTTCQGTPTLVTRDGIEYLEAAGSTYRLYLDVDGAVPMTATGTLTIDATSIRYEQLGCIPAGTDCDDLPTMLLMAR